MKVNILPLFSTPIYVAHDDEIPDEKMVEWLDYIRTLEDDRNPALDGACSKSNDLLEHKQLIELKKVIEWHMDEYLYNVLKIREDFKYRFTSSFVNIHIKGDKAAQHCHQNSMFSGVFYLKVPPNSGNLRFTHPVHAPSVSIGAFEPIFVEANYYNSRSVTVEVRDKTVCLFPGHAFHGVPPNLSDETRYALAFNTIVTGSYGVSVSDYATIL